MSRHPVDHRTPPEGGRTEHFAQVERQSGAAGSHPASRALHRRPAARGAGQSRVAAYARIERGREA
ncbi:MAG: hypothetical protein NXH83_11900 [Rhodobacteraceae bacterium]|jgi:hypothetical protein|nr:hypothetical protein [Paracoccaceae bacterium]